jgi:hypothetical protein
MQILRATIVLASLASLAAVGCRRHRHAQTPPPPPPQPVYAAPAPPPPVQCPPLGVWRVSGPAGAQEVRVQPGTAPGQYQVVYQGATLGQGTASMSGNNFQVDLGQATGGLYNCVMAADCNSMSCGFAGQPPTVFQKNPNAM